MIKELQVEDLNNFKILCEEYKDNFFDLYNVSNIFNNPFQKIYVFKQEKELVGFIFIEKLYETLNILHIYVTSAYRNQNKASLLIDYVLSDSTIENIILEVNVNNKPAIRLYEKFDFRIINIREKYYNGIDAYVMEKRVQK